MTHEVKRRIYYTTAQATVWAVIVVMLYLIVANHMTRWTP